LRGARGLVAVVGGVVESANTPVVTHTNTQRVNPR